MVKIVKIVRVQFCIHNPFNKRDFTFKLHQQTKQKIIFVRVQISTDHLDRSVLTDNFMQINNFSIHIAELI